MSTLLFPICLSGRVTSTNLPRLPLARQLLHPRVVFAAAACEPHRKGRQGEERNGPILLRLFCMQEDTCPEARARTTQRRNERAGRVFSGHRTRSRARYKTAAASGSSPAGFGLAPSSDPLGSACSLGSGTRTHVGSPGPWTDQLTAGLCRAPAGRLGGLRVRLIPPYQARSG
jgi:hypothetical protein